MQQLSQAPGEVQELSVTCRARQTIDGPHLHALNQVARHDASLEVFSSAQVHVLYMLKVG